MSRSSRPITAVMPCVTMSRVVVTGFAIAAVSPLLVAPAATYARPGAPAAPAPFAVSAARRQQLRALIPVRGMLGRRIDPAPAGADAIRISVFGDNSGGKLQVRLLAPGEDGALTGYFAPPDIIIDFQGWKTLTLPLSSFAFRSDNNPETVRDGMGSPEALVNAAGIQVAVLSPATKVFLDDLGWVKADSAATDPPLAVIDAFDNADAVANWKPVGDFNERRAVEYSANKVPAYVQAGGGSMQVIVRSSGQVEQQLYEPALRARLAKIPTQPYLVYVRQPFVTITSDSTPTPVEQKTLPSLSLFATPGETEPTTFAVYAGLPLKGSKVTIKVAPVRAAVKGKAAAATIPASAIDVHVVHGLSSIENAPQVLVKDDREPLTGPIAKVRLTGEPATDIPAGTSRQFWVTVRVPKNQSPGTYTGRLAFYGPGIKPTLIPLTIEVLPLELRTAHFQYGIDLMSVLQPSDSPIPGEHVVTPEQMAAQLADIRDHGFRVVALHGKPSALADELKIYKDTAVSLAGPVVVASPLNGTDDFTAVEGLRASVGLAPTFEMYYRLPLAATRDADAATKYLADAKAANRNALVVSPVDASSTYGELSKSLGDALAPIYSLSCDYAQKVLAEGRRFTANRDWWSWNICQESPARNRLLAGFLLMKTGNGLYGAFPGPYQMMPDGMDPFTLLSGTAGIPAADPSGMVPQMAAFPVEGGVLDTLQWEAVREGIDDVRYADLLKTLSRELKDLKKRKDVTDHADSYLIGILSKPLMSLTPRDHQLFRRGLAEECVKLKAILDKLPKSSD